VNDHNVEFEVRIASLEEFRASRAIWNAIVEQMSAPTIFCTWEWIYGWWECFGNRYEEPVIIFVYSGTALRGIFPLVKRTAMLRASRLLGRVLTYAGEAELFPDQVDIIAAPDDARECMASVFEFLRTRYRRWDAVELPLVTENSYLASWIRGKGDKYGACARGWIAASVAPYVTLQGQTFEQFVASLGDKQKRYYVRTRAKKLKEQGIYYRSCNAGDEAECIAEVFRLHATRAKQKMLKSNFAGNELVRFHQAFVRRISGKSWLWLRFLVGQDATVAGFYGFQIGGRVLFYQLGFDSAWQRWSPGMALVDEALREAFAQGCKEFNFLQGSEKYKYFWTQREYRLYRGYVFNHTALGCANVMVLALRRWLKNLLLRRISDGEGRE